MKNFITFLLVIVFIACTLFWRQVWDIFAGMTVLESLNTIVTFILHVTVATIATYAAVTLTEFIKPWLKAFRKSKRAQRRGRIAQQPAVITRSLKLNTNQMMQAWLMQQMGINKRTSSAAHEEPQSYIRLDF